MFCGRREKRPSGIPHLSAHLRAIAALTKEALGVVREGQKPWYNEQVPVQIFIPGQEFLHFLPTLENKLQVKWQGLHKMQHRVGKIYYEIAISHKGLTLFHVNLLKAWMPGEEPAQYRAESNWQEEGEQWSRELVQQAVEY